MGKTDLPAWAQTMREIFRAETISQFVLSGNINDFVLHKVKGKTVHNRGLVKGENQGGQGAYQTLTLNRFLVDVMFQSFDAVLVYDRGTGLQALKGPGHFFSYLKVFDKFHGTQYASNAGIDGESGKSLDSPGLMPRDPGHALELIDRFIKSVSTFSQTSSKKKSLPVSVGVIIDFANFIVPRGDPLHMTGELGANLIKIMNWAEDPSIMGANIATVLVTENLSDLSIHITESPYSSKIHIPLPDAGEIDEYIRDIVSREPSFPSLCEVETPVLSRRLVGLSRINVKGLILRAIRNNRPITMDYLTRLKKEIIEKEAFGKLEFIESRRTLDDVAGHTAAKKWLRNDIQLIKKGAVNCLPMGYLVSGRIGTGKTYLVECFAGECGIPFVKLKNFREKWVGATEGNLEKIFSILHALGQVVVFIDEADQITGRRTGGGTDSGLSGRIYGMLAAEMSKTENRGKLFWIFATSRPDLVEVDLKRQGRLDVHIPLFPPDDERGIKHLFLAMARKLKIKLKTADLPPFNFREPLSGNELEGLLVRALRRYELQTDEKDTRKTLPEILAKEIKKFRPSRHTAMLELMDLLAVKECTDESFLPRRFRDMSPEDVEKRIDELHYV